MSLTLLIAVDGSPFSERILPPMMQLAAQAAAKVYLLRVLPPAHDSRKLAHPADVVPLEPAALAALAAHSHPPEAGTREVETVAQAATRHRQEALASLTALASRFPGVRVQCLVQEGRHPAEVIVREAKHVGADLVALATHGHHAGLTHALHHNVAEQVVQASTVPVVLLRVPA